MCLRLRTFGYMFEVLLVPLEEVASSRDDVLLPGMALNTY